jgi:hypothetical protein
MPEWRCINTDVACAYSVLAAFPFFPFGRCSSQVQLRSLASKADGVRYAQDRRTLQLAMHNRRSSPIEYRPEHAPKVGDHFARSRWKLGAGIGLYRHLRKDASHNSEVGLVNNVKVCFERLLNRKCAGVPLPSLRTLVTTRSKGSDGKA